MSSRTASHSLPKAAGKLKAKALSSSSSSFALLLTANLTPLVSEDHKLLYTTERKTAPPRRPYDSPPAEIESSVIVASRYKRTAIKLKPSEPAFF